MNIWKWVTELSRQAYENGDHRLAELIERLPGHVCDDNYTEVDAMVPELLHLARQQNNKWLEIFVRHWNLQSRVFDRSEGRGMLPEAIDLLDFCHQDDTRECPQAVCVVQDLAACYANIDYKAYARDRIAVAEETLQRIDPRWPCFDCIGTEYSDALADAGETEKAIHWIQDARKQATTMQADADILELSEIDVLCLQEDWQQALTVALKSENPAGGDSYITKIRTRLVIIYCHLGEYEKALENRDSFASIREGAGYFHRWSQGSLLLAQAGVIENDWILDSQLDYMACCYQRQGVLRSAIDISHHQASLAIARQRPHTVTRCIERIQQLIQELPQDLGATEQLEQLVQAHKAMASPAEANYPNLDAVYDVLSDDVELNLLTLSAARQQFPDAEDILFILSDQLEQLSRLNEADLLLEEHLQQHPHSSGAMLRYGMSLLQQNRNDELQALLARPAPEDEMEYQTNWHWLKAHVAEQQQDPLQITHHLEAILKIQPEARNTLRWHAQICNDMERYEQAIGSWHQLIEQSDELQHHYWDLMVSATLARRWDLVHQAIAALDIDYSAYQLQTDQEIDIDMEVIRLQHRDANGRTHQLRARRTGPVTARVIDITLDTQYLFFGNSYVFDAAPLNQLDQEDDEGYACDEEGYYTHLFPVVKKFQDAEYKSCFIDGFLPDETRWKNLSEELDSLGISLDIRSGTEYVLEDKEEEHPAIYCFIAYPPDVSAATLADILEQHLSDSERPIIWPELLELADKPEQLAQHRQWQEQYDIY